MKHFRVAVPERESFRFDWFVDEFVWMDESKILEIDIVHIIAENIIIYCA